MRRIYMLNVRKIAQPKERVSQFEWLTDNHTNVYSQNQPRRGGQTVARGEQSEPLVKEARNRAPQGAMGFQHRPLRRPFGALNLSKRIPGVRFAHPRLLSDRRFAAQSRHSSNLEIGDNAGRVFQPVLFAEQFSVVRPVCT
jgi:hypothetical protein